MKKTIIVLSFFIASISSTFAKDLVIAKDGKTDYQIVAPANNPKDQWNAGFLAWFLNEKTGATFPVVAPDKDDPAKPAIYIGASEPVEKLLGRPPLTGMNDQDHVVRSVGKDILLYGAGHDADFYAVMDFLDKEFSFRYYRGWPVIVRQPDVTLKPMDRALSYGLKKRQLGKGFSDYLQGENSYFPNKNVFAIRKKKETGKRPPISLKAKVGDFPEITPEKIAQDICHTEFRYIPCDHHRSRGYEFIENKDYFKTHPEFFGMDGKGIRSPKTEHLCFANKELRKEFTKNIEKHLKALGTDNVEICVHYTDNCNKACHCEECAALEKKYGTTGAPLFEYILELADEFKTKHPKTTIMTLLYRESQTQFPPVLKDRGRFPDNVLFCYAGISFKTNRDVRHPVNKRAYEDLVRWSKLSDNIFVWVYYALYGDIRFLPYAGDKIMVDYIRAVNKLGLKGMFFEFYNYSPFPSDEKKLTGLAPRNFCMLDRYLFYRFSKDPSLDYETEVRDYMKRVYGPVANLAKRYHDELQRAGTIDNPYSMVLRGKNFKKELAYLSPENLHRWEKLFDAMEVTLGDEHPEILKKVKLLRKPLDTAVYGRWLECAKAFPGYFNDPNMIRKRIGEPSKHPFAKGLKDFLFTADMRINYAGKEKPLPDQLKDVPKDRIRRLVPRNNANDPTMSNVPKIVPDDEAALGYAASVNLPDLPFNFGYYSFDTKEHGPRVTLTAADIKPGEYQLHHLGEIQPTNGNCVIWFSSRSWGTNLDVSTLYDLKETAQKWDAWVSLKFPENYNGGKDELVLCDQIILVKRDN